MCAFKLSEKGIDFNMDDNNVIHVDMGECIVLSGESKEYLETNGLGPCVGVAIVIKTYDKKVHRLLGHIIMEEEPKNSFEELEVCSNKIKTNTKDNIESIEISFTTSISYRNHQNLTKDEKILLRLICTHFGIKYTDIKFKYSQQIQISPDGVVATNFLKKQIPPDKAVGRE